MNDQFFRPHGVVSTEYILPAAAVISCGAKLHDFKETGEDPCIRQVVKRNGKSEIKTIFQFHETTSRGEQLRKLFAAYKQLDFNEPCALPENHTLRIARNVLTEASRLRLVVQKAMTDPVGVPMDGYGTINTAQAAALSCLGREIKGVRRISERAVSFFFEDTFECVQLAGAFEKPWGQYDLDQDHPIYHMKGALENRESLIILLKRASTRVEVKQNGKRFFLPLNASKEKLTEMVQKLNQ